jgi:hypothetical protein
MRDAKINKPGQGNIISMNQYFSTNTAIFLTIFAASMWGSWMQIIKHRKNYPLSGMTFLIYSYSFILIWAVTLILAPVLLPEGIMTAVKENREVIPVILIGGGMMSLGLLVSLHVMNLAGLLLSTAVSGAMGSILGIFTSIWQEGVPGGPRALAYIIVCTAVFILAGFISNYAAVLRDKDKAEKARRDGSPIPADKNVITVKVVLMIFLSTILVNGWSIGVSAGTARGVPPILTCALMATGSFLSIFVVCGVMYTRKKQWKTILCIGDSKKPMLLCFISSFCHYGGNLISIYAMPVISATQSFLFGRTSSVLTYFWGFFYREFAGSRKRTIVILSVGILFYFIGLALLGYYNYRYKN